MDIQMLISGEYYRMIDLENIVYYPCSITAENLTLEILLQKVVYPSNEPLNMISDHTHPYLEIFVCKKVEPVGIYPSGFYYEKKQGIAPL